MRSELRRLEKAMKVAAEALKFEEAAELRDEVKRVKRLLLESK